MRARAYALPVRPDPVLSEISPREATPELRVVEPLVPAQALPENRKRWAALAARDDANDTGLCCELGAIWKQFACGRLEVVDAFLSETAAFLVFREHSQLGMPRGMQHARFFKHALATASITAAAIDAGLSPAAASLRMTALLRQFGVSCCGSKVPLPVLLVAHAADCSFRHVARELTAPEDRGLRIVRWPRPDLTLRRQVTPSEWQVTKLLIEGQTHEQIARERGTSKRTVANQLSSVFRTLRVSGRLELLRAVASSTHSVDETV